MQIFIVIIQLALLKVLVRKHAHHPNVRHHVAHPIPKRIAQTFFTKDRLQFKRGVQQGRIDVVQFDEFFHVGARSLQGSVEQSHVNGHGVQRGQYPEQRFNVSFQRGPVHRDQDGFQRTFVARRAIFGQHMDQFMVVARAKRHHGQHEIRQRQPFFLWKHMRQTRFQQHGPSHVKVQGNFMNGRVSFGGGGDAAEDLVHFFHLFQGELAQHGDFGGLFEVGLRQVVGGQDVQLGQLLFDEQPFLMDEVGLELIETVGDGEVALVQAVLGLRGAGVEEGVAHGGLDGRGCSG